MMSLNGQELESQPSVVFYDGHCGLCSAVVRFLLPRTPAIVVFAPLGGSTAKRLLPDHCALADSVVVWSPEQGVLQKAAALGFLAGCLCGAWRALVVIKYLPHRWVDLAYDQVAKRRHKLPLGRSACELRMGPQGLKRLWP